VIAHVCKLSHYDDWQKVIISNDKDFLQLCDENTILYRPTADVVMNKKRVIENYGIHPSNMALARAIDGDASDNLPGIKGAGLKSISKRLSFLASEKDYTIDEVVEFCENADSKLKFFSNIVEGRELIEHNYKMMQLYAPMLSYQSKDFVKTAVEEFDCNFNKTQIIKKTREDGFGELNWEELKTYLNRIASNC